MLFDERVNVTARRTPSIRIVAGVSVVETAHDVVWITIFKLDHTNVACQKMRVVHCGTSLREVPREQKMLKRHLPRVIYHKLPHAIDFRALYGVQRGLEMKKPRNLKDMTIHDVQPLTHSALIIRHVCSCNPPNLEKTKP